MNKALRVKNWEKHETAEASVNAIHVGTSG